MASFTTVGTSACKFYTLLALFFFAFAFKSFMFTKPTLIAGGNNCFSKVIAKKRVFLEPRLNFVEVVCHNWYVVLCKSFRIKHAPLDCTLQLRTVLNLYGKLLRIIAIKSSLGTTNGTVVYQFLIELNASYIFVGFSSEHIETVFNA